MKNYFLQEIIINDVLDIQGFSIPLSTDTRQHLMITGKNGSGKTTLLNEINILLNKFIQNGFSRLSQIKQDVINYEQAINSHLPIIASLEKEIVKLRTASQNMTDEQIKSAIVSHQSNIANHKSNIKSWEQNRLNLKNQLDSFSKINLVFNSYEEVYSDMVSGDFILAYFKAKRHQSAVTPTTITKQEFIKVNRTEESLSKTFVQFMVNQYTQKVYAKDEGNHEEAQKIEEWFIRFENSLKELFDKPSLKLVYDRKKFNFHLVYDKRQFGFDGFSDGYASVLSIVTELILRMEAHEVSVYDMQGLVLIDELETHLHVDLQKKIFPFLTSFFPNIQFIVTTHSPFVLSSISNAVICDLENKMIVKDLTAYSYDALIESYFNSDKYSQEIKVKIARFDALLAQKNMVDADKEEFYDLKNYLKSLPTFMADELAVKIKDQLLLARKVEL